MGHGKGEEGKAVADRARSGSRRIWTRSRRCWGMPAGPRRRGPTARGCCCRASARASSRWRRGSNPAGCRATHQSHAPRRGQGRVGRRGPAAAVRERVLPAIERHGPVRYWIVDDTGFPKQGRHSVGVARQYCGQLGKQDNCQVAVSLSVANDQASLPIAYRLYLPEVWAEDPAGGPRRGCRRRSSSRPSRPSRSGRSGGRWRRACRSASCWPMPATATSATSGSGWVNSICATCWASAPARASGRPGRRHCRPRPGRAGDGRRRACAAARTTSRSRSRTWPRACPAGLAPGHLARGQPSRALLPLRRPAGTARAPRHPALGALAGGVAADRVAEGRRGADEILALQPAAAHRPEGPGPYRQGALA